MKNTLFAPSLALLASLVLPSVARATDYPVLDEYRTLAQSLYDSAQKAATPEELQALQAQTRPLVELGVEIMKLYAQKNPVCNDQFTVMLGEVPQMESMPLADVYARYHNAVGLPSAPRHCYFGRSQVVHPMMNIIRLGGEWTSRVRGQAVHEYEEVIEHLAKIEQNLDNPPN